VLYDSFGMKWVWIFQIIKSFGYWKKGPITCCKHTKKKKEKVNLLHTIIFMFWLVFFVKKFQPYCKRCKASSILSWAIVVGLATSWLSSLYDTPPNTTIDLLQAIYFRYEEIHPTHYNWPTTNDQFLTW
jgi:hypothetical protein